MLAGGGRGRGRGSGALQARGGAPLRAAAPPPSPASPLPGPPRAALLPVSRPARRLRRALPRRRPRPRLRLPCRLRSPREGNELAGGRVFARARPLGPATVLGGAGPRASRRRGGGEAAREGPRAGRGEGPSSGCPPAPGAGHAVSRAPPLPRSAPRLWPSFSARGYRSLGLSASRTRARPEPAPCPSSSVLLSLTVSVSLPPSGDTAGGRLKPVDCSRGPATAPSPPSPRDRRRRGQPPLRPQGPPLPRAGGLRVGEDTGTPFAFQSGSLFFCGRSPLSEEPPFLCLGPSSPHSSHFSRAVPVVRAGAASCLSAKDPWLSDLSCPLGASSGPAKQRTTVNDVRERAGEVSVTLPSPELPGSPGLSGCPSPCQLTWQGGPCPPGPLLLHYPGRHTYSPEGS